MVTLTLLIAAWFLSLTVPLIAALAVTCADALAHNIKKLKLKVKTTVQTDFEKRWHWDFMGSLLKGGTANHGCSLSGD